MTVFVCTPSARPIPEVQAWAAKWLSMGYQIAIQRDPGAGDSRDFPNCKVIVRNYAGWAESVNYLTRLVLRNHTDCDWCVAAGDDTLPDPNKRAEDIAFECIDHFIDPHPGGEKSGMFGVMQPTGDDWQDHRGRIIERIAGSPWLGRQWCLRANCGDGPLYPGFFHMFADELLQEHAKQLGIFWQRPDLNQYHAHWARPRADIRDMPAFLKQANSPEEWKRSKAIFESLKAVNFAVCAPL